MFQLHFLEASSAKRVARALRQPTESQVQRLFQMDPGDARLDTPYELGARNTTCSGVVVTTDAGSVVVKEAQRRAHAAASLISVA